MGNRKLAVIFLDHIEKSSLTSGILFYKRYIDDVFTIGTTKEVLVEALERLNSHDANITFTRHRTLRHEKESAPSFDVRVLHRYLVRPLERKIMEARIIYRIKPEINAKEEMRDLLRVIE
ncbi:hypothetical protein V3C99_001361 [Haemonchus contortus]|uniref:Reverse transcriptase domain-containing protein n=1 Tax=Haemonchus contortus TaxID=6289 RepID=A0A7I5E987_HAECO